MFSDIVSQNETCSTQKVPFKNYPKKSRKKTKGEAREAITNFFDFGLPVTSPFIFFFNF